MAESDLRKAVLSNHPGPGPDFVKLAEAYGLKGFRAGSQAEFEDAFRQALETGRGCVIDCAIDMDAMVHPMVGGGTPVTEFLLH